MPASLEAAKSPDALPTLPDGWRYEELGNLVEERGICYGIVQPGIAVADGVPILRVNNIIKAFPELPRYSAFTLRDYVNEVSPRFFDLKNLGLAAFSLPSMIPVLAQFPEASKK